MPGFGAAPAPCPALSATHVSAPQGKLSPPNVHDPVPLFAVRTDAEGRRVVAGIEPVFNDRLNPGNNLLVRIQVSRYWRYYVVGRKGAWL
jgi:hypothetical protein